MKPVLFSCGLCERTDVGYSNKGLDGWKECEVCNDEFCPNCASNFICEPPQEVIDRLTDLAQKEVQDDLEHRWASIKDNILSDFYEGLIEVVESLGAPCRMIEQLQNYLIEHPFIPIVDACPDFLAIVDWLKDEKFSRCASGEIEDVNEIIWELSKILNNLSFDKYPDREEKTIILVTHRMGTMGKLLRCTQDRNIWEKKYFKNPIKWFHTFDDDNISAAYYKEYSEIQEEDFDEEWDNMCPICNGDEFSNADKYEYMLNKFCGGSEGILHERLIADRKL
jgi:hypothetical protein